MCVCLCVLVCVRMYSCVSIDVYGPLDVYVKPRVTLTGSFLTLLLFGNQKFRLSEESPKDNTKITIKYDC